MKPRSGRSRAVIEHVTPALELGRFPIKRIVGERVQVTAAVYGDGHDHICARLLYRPDNEKEWRAAPMRPLGNDLWQGEFTPDSIGVWRYTVEGWVDHFSTWRSDLKKRIDAQPYPANNAPAGFRTPEEKQSAKDIALAFRTGGALLDRASAGARGADARTLKGFASSLRWLAERDTQRFEDPVTPELEELAEKHPDLIHSTFYPHELPVVVDRARARFSTWYEFFPRSAGEDGQHGTFETAAKLFPSIAQAGFDVVYFPPVHPVGRAFRKGKNNSVTAEAGDVGSPWAIGTTDGGHTATHPDLGTLQDFDRMVDAANHAGLEIALDIAFQCSPDHPWVRNHPEWFLIRPDGSIQYAENPPKKYQDIYPLNFESDEWQELWHELAGVFLFWVRRGIRIFRVDNPHTKSLPFWEWCIREIKRSYPDVLFLAEAFTRPHVMYGLAERGFTQSYTYFTWRETKADLVEYLTELTTPPVSDFFRPNFWPNTPDILPKHLQTGNRAAFEARAVLAATLSSNYGIYGPAFELMDHLPMRENSEEYLHSEKYQLRQWDRHSPESLMPLLTQLNFARRGHTALQSNESLHFHTTDNEHLICYSKREGDDVLLMVVNLNFEAAESGWTDLDMERLGLDHTESYEVHDLLRNETYTWQGPHNFILLDPEKSPAHVLHLRRRASIFRNA